MPITVASATEDHSIRFHLYHLEDMGRVRVRKYCEIKDREVDQGEIGKGYQLTKEQVIPISDEELRDLPLPTAKAIEIVSFVPLDSVDPPEDRRGLLPGAQRAGRREALQTAPHGPRPEQQGGRREVRVVRSRAPRIPPGPRGRHRFARHALA